MPPPAHPAVPAPALAPARASTARFAQFLFAYYAHAGAFATYVSLFFAARGMSAPQIGVLISLIQVLRIIGPNLWGYLADRSGQRVQVLRLTAAGALLATAGLFFAEGFNQFLVVMVLLNLFTSAQAPLCEALALGAMQGDISGYGRVRMWGSVGFISAVLAGGYVLDWFSVHALPWMAMALMGCTLLASLRIGQGERRLATAGAGPSLLSVLRQPEVMAFFLQAALMFAGHMALNAFYSLYLERAGYSKPLIGIMWSLGVVCEVLFFFYQVEVFVRFSARTVILGAFALAIVRYPLIATGSGSILLLLIAQLMHAGTFAAHHSASILTMQRWFAGPLQARGQALYASLAFGVGGTLGGLSMSFCWERYGAASVYWLATALAALGMASAYWSFWRMRQRR